MTLLATPQFVGLTLKQAQALAVADGITLTQMLNPFLNIDASVDPQGLVYSQFPPAGSQPNTFVNIVVLSTQRGTMNHTFNGPNIVISDNGNVPDVSTTLTADATNWAAGSTPVSLSQFLGG